MLLQSTAGTPVPSRTSPCHIAQHAAPRTTPPHTCPQPRHVLALTGRPCVICPAAQASPYSLGTRECPGLLFRLPAAPFAPNLHGLVPSPHLLRCAPSRGLSQVTRSKLSAPVLPPLPFPLPYIPPPPPLFRSSLLGFSFSHSLHQ